MINESQKQNNIDNPRHVFVTNEVVLRPAIIEHIPLTPIAATIQAASPISQGNYRKGSIQAYIPATVTGAVELQVRYSHDLGVTIGAWKTIHTFAGSTEEEFARNFDDLIEHAAPLEPPTEVLIKRIPEFWLRFFGGGGTGNVYCFISLER